MSDGQPDSANIGGYHASAMPCSTTLSAPHGQRIVEELGLCWGLTVRSMGITRGFTSSFKTLQRGEVPKMTENYDDGRQEAVDRTTGSLGIRNGNQDRARHLVSAVIES